MDLTQFYNHAHMMNEVRTGAAIVNAMQAGNEVQQYNVGDVVRSTAHGTYTFTRGVVVEVYKDNGYFRYVCQIDGCTHTARTKDIRRAER